MNKSHYKGRQRHPSDKFSNKIKQSQSEKIDEPIGLPNLGNICFLNSILQFLYCTNLQDYIIINESLIAFWPNCILGEIRQIFSYLRTKKNRQKCIQTLQKMIKNLEIINFSYKKYRQQDAFQTLLNILNQIQGVINKSLPLNIFIQENCQICKRKIQLKVKYLSLKHSVCGKCKYKERRTLLNFPKYIIYTNYQQEKVSLFVDQMTRFQEQPRRYKLISQIVYVGNKSSGHYYCLRVHQNNWYQLNDHYFQKVQSNQLQNYRGAILLYQMFTEQVQVFNISPNNLEKKTAKNSLVFKTEKQQMIPEKASIYNINKNLKKVQIGENNSNKHVNEGIIKRPNQYTQNERNTHINQKTSQRNKQSTRGSHTINKAINFTHQNTNKSPIVQTSSKINLMKNSDIIQINKSYKFEIMAPEYFKKVNGKYNLKKFLCLIQFKLRSDDKKKFWLQIQNSINFKYAKYKADQFKIQFNNRILDIKLKHKNQVIAAQLRQLIQSFLLKITNKMIQDDPNRLKGLNDNCKQSFNKQLFSFDSNIRLLKKLS